MTSKLKKVWRHWAWVATLMSMTVAGTGSVYMLQSYRQSAAPVIPAVSHAPLSAMQSPQDHLMLKFMPEQKIFVGFLYEGRVYMDAWEFCATPGFRGRSQKDANVQADESQLVQTPDIRLPVALNSRAWKVVRADRWADTVVFNTAYQWLGFGHIPPHASCLFLGQHREGAASEPEIFISNKAEPVIGLMGMDGPTGLQLQAQGDAVDITPDNRAKAFVEYPWLHAWMKRFAVKSAEKCNSTDGFMPATRLLPVSGLLIAGEPAVSAWFAMAGCDTMEDWTLVIVGPDGATTFVDPKGQAKSESYWPHKVWTVDLDGDGTQEFLIQANYYEASSHVVLKLTGDRASGYRLEQVARSAYEGL